LAGWRRCFKTLGVGEAGLAPDDDLGLGFEAGPSSGFAGTREEGSGGEEGSDLAGTGEESSGIAGTGEDRSGGEEGSEFAGTGEEGSECAGTGEEGSGGATGLGGRSLGGLCGEGLGWGLNLLFSFNIHQTRTNRTHTFLYFSNGDTVFARFFGKSGGGFIILKNDANSLRSFFNSFHFALQAWYQPFPG